MFKLLKTIGCQQYSPSIKCALHLFDATVKPILLYGCEVWGSQIFNPTKLLKKDNMKTKEYFQFPFEKLHLRFCKYILRVNSKSTNIAVLSELGRFPLLIEAVISSIRFFMRMGNYDKTSILYDCFLSNLESMGENSDCWLKNIKILCENLGLNHLWENYGTKHEKRDTKISRTIFEEIYLKQYNKDLFDNERPSNPEQGNKLRTFRLFKDNYQQEKYLNLIQDINIRKQFTRLRISAHNLMIEKGRHRRPKPLPVDKQICRYCNLGNIEDELHIIIKCNHFSHVRKKLYEKLNEIFPDFDKYNDQDKFIFLMKCSDYELALAITKFLRNVEKIRGPL